jgi:transposase-like protein|tara:strand:- start:32 stop:1276 length:1245 start_codon:yes stop_codon:yes gene_type:complete
MRKGNTNRPTESTVEWSHLEEWVRGQIQGLIQEMLEGEITEFLGRVRSARRSSLDGDPGYRNGYSKPRRLTLSSGTIQVRRPRVRNTEERFESRVLPLFARKSKEVADLIPELYLHGLAEGDFDLALRSLLGDGAPVSASTVARLKEKWHAELSEWRGRPLDDLEVVYMWVDGVYVKAGLERDKAAILVVLAALSDGRKVIVTAVPGYRESIESWSEVLRDLKRRGMKCPRLFVGDGHLGIWGALRNVYPQAAEQRCWNHKIVNVLGRLPKREHTQAKLILCRIPYAETRMEAQRLKTRFLDWCHERNHEAAAETLDRDWERMMTFYRFPREHWQHLRTTNPVESPFAALRLRTDAAKRYKRVDRAIAVIWKMLLIAEKRFRRLKAPELMMHVYDGTQYVDGMAIEATAEEVAA